MAMVVLNVHAIELVMNDPEDKVDHHFERVQNNELLYYTTLRQFVVIVFPTK